MALMSGLPVDFPWILGISKLAYMMLVAFLKIMSIGVSGSQSFLLSITAIGKKYLSVSEVVSWAIWKAI